MIKAKAAIYLKTQGFTSMDLTNVEAGNPGMGGTQYNHLCLPLYYNKFYSNIDWTYVTNEELRLNSSFKKVVVRDFVDLMAAIVDDNIAYLVYRYQDWVFEENELNVLHECGVKLILWGHNTPFKDLRKIAKMKVFWLYIPVGKEQTDMLYDHPIWNKLFHIPNGFDDKPYSLLSSTYEKRVTYIGSLIEAKGFHALARIWPEVVKQCPEARLSVIGSGKLYNRDDKLGEHELAEASYEARFMDYLIHNGVLNTVTFHGTMGVEKKAILERSLIGVVNPTGQTENCPGSAIEFQAAGIPVVSGAYWGLLDTVLHGKTGLLVSSDKKLVESILFYLNNVEIAKEHGRQGRLWINTAFNYSKVCEQWYEVFRASDVTSLNTNYKMKDNYLYQYKWLAFFFGTMLKLMNANRKWFPAMIEYRGLLNKIFVLKKKIV